MKKFYVTKVAKGSKELIIIKIAAEKYFGEKLKCTNTRNLTSSKRNHGYKSNTTNVHSIYKKTKTPLHKTSQITLKFATTSWIGKNNAWKWKRNESFQIKVQAKNLRSKATGKELHSTAVASNIIYKNTGFKTFTSFINFLKEINNTQIDNTKDVEVAMPM